MSELGPLRDKNKSKTVCIFALVHMSLIKDPSSAMVFDSAQESQPPAVPHADRLSYSAAVGLSFLAIRARFTQTLTPRGVPENT